MSQEARPRYRSHRMPVFLLTTVLAAGLPICDTVWAQSGHPAEAARRRVEALTGYAAQGWSTGSMRTPGRNLARPPAGACTDQEVSFERPADAVEAGWHSADYAPFMFNWAAGAFGERVAHGHGACRDGDLVVRLWQAAYQKPMTGRLSRAELQELMGLIDSAAAPIAQQRRAAASRDTSQAAASGCPLADKLARPGEELLLDRLPADSATIPATYFLPPITPALFNWIRTPSQSRGKDWAGDSRLPAMSAGTASALTASGNEALLIDWAALHLGRTPAVPVHLVAKAWQTLSGERASGYLTARDVQCLAQVAAKAAQLSSESVTIQGQPLKAWLAAARARRDALRAQKERDDEAETARRAAETERRLREEQERRGRPEGDRR